MTKTKIARSTSVGKRAVKKAVIDKHLDPAMSVLDETNSTKSAAQIAPTEPVVADEPHVATAEAEQFDTYELPPVKHRWWHRRAALNQQSKLAFMLSAGLVLLLLAPAAGAYAYYQKRALPNQSVAGIKVGGKTEAQIAGVLSAQVAGLKVGVKNGDDTLQPSLDQVGIGVDVATTAREAVMTRHWSLWQKQNLPLKVTIDQAKVQEYEQNLVHTTAQPAVDAKLVYKDGAFTISPDKTGQSTGISDSIKQLAAAGLPKAEVKLLVSTQTLQPAVRATELADVQKSANEFLAVPLTLTYQGQSFTPNKDQLSSWVSVNNDPANRPFTAGIDTGKVAAYVETVSKALYLAPVDRKVTTNKDQNNAETVMEVGRAGRQMTGKQAIIDKLSAAFQAKQRLSVAITTEDVGFKTVAYNTFDRYIDIDLSAKQLIAYEKGVAVGTFAVSNGDARHPTIPGEYAIYAKTRSQTMKGGTRGAGDYFSLPNVEWISWYHGDYSIHGAYWHNLFGIRDVSHGCTNMRNADAEFIYNWAPIGTKIVIHA